MHGSELSLPTIIFLVQNTNLILSIHCPQLFNDPCYRINKNKRKTKNSLVWHSESSVVCSESDALSDLLPYISHLLASPATHTLYSFYSFLENSLFITYIYGLGYLFSISPYWNSIQLLRSSQNCTFSIKFCPTLPIRNNCSSLCTPALCTSF